MNGGVVVKINASQKYTTDAMTAALFGEICRRVGVPVQRFANRADMPGGSTLGNLQGHSLSAPMLDIGLAQMAMHSAVETAGVEDIGSMIRAVRASIKRRLSAREMEAIESGDPAGEVSNAALQQKRVFRPGCAMLPQHRDMGEKIRVFKASACEGQTRTHDWHLMQTPETSSVSRSMLPIGIDPRTGRSVCSFLAGQAWLSEICGRAVRFERRVIGSKRRFPIVIQGIDVRLRQYLRDGSGKGA